MVKNFVKESYLEVKYMESARINNYSKITIISTKSFFELVKLKKLLFIQIRAMFFVFSTFFILLLSNNSFYAQNQIANFSTGKTGTKTYEHISFWIEDNERGDITYSYGKNRREIKLKYSGTDNLDGIKAFKVEFPNNEVFYVIPQKTFLKVINKKTSYDKIFRWEYEGPINGIGTWCDACTQNGKESLDLIRKYFF